MSYRIIDLLPLLLTGVWNLIGGRRRDLKRSDQLFALQAFPDAAEFARRRFVRQVGDVEQERLQTAERLFRRQIALHLSVAPQQDVLIEQPPGQLSLVSQLGRRKTFRGASVAERAQHQLRLLEMPDRFRREERGGDKRLVKSSRNDNVFDHLPDPLFAPN